MAENGIVIAKTDGQTSSKDTDCPIDSLEYLLDTTFYESTDFDNTWFYIQTNEDKCGTFIISVWYEETHSNDSVIMPRCSIKIYRRKPGLFWPSSKMEFIGTYKFVWGNTYTWTGVSNPYQAEVLINLIYDEVYNNDNLYYIKFDCSETPTGIFNHMIRGYQDEKRIYQAALWIRETPINCFNYITSSLTSKGAINQIIYLDRTLVGIFISSLTALQAEINIAKAKKTMPVTVKDIAVTVIASILSLPEGVGFFSGIGISLMVTGIANSNNVIENPEESLIGQILKFNKENTYTNEDQETGSSYTDSNDGMKITLRTKILLQTNGYEDTDSVEVWDKGTLGKDYEKLVQGPKFYKGNFQTDSQLFDGGVSKMSIEKISEIFGWTDYLKLAKEKL